MGDTNNKYSRICSKFWTDEKNMRWTDDEKLIGLYLLSCEHQVSEGLYRIPLNYIAGDLDWSIDRVKKSILGLIKQGFIDYDFDAKVVLILKALKYNNPNCPNQRISLIKRLKELPKTKLMHAFLMQCKIYNALLGAEILQEIFANTKTGIPKELNNDKGLEWYINGIGNTIAYTILMAYLSPPACSILYTLYSNLYTLISLKNPLPPKKNASELQDKKCKPKSKKLADIQTEFEAYWKTEPIKSDKRRTEKNINKLIKDKKINIKELITYRQRYLEHAKRRTDKQYWKHPANFFGQDGTWEDWTEENNSNEEVNGYGKNFSELEIDEQFRAMYPDYGH